MQKRPFLERVALRYFARLTFPLAAGAALIGHAMPGLRVSGLL